MEACSIFPSVPKTAWDAGSAHAKPIQLVPSKSIITSPAFILLQEKSQPTDTNLAPLGTALFLQHGL